MSNIAITEGSRLRSFEFRVLSGYDVIFMLMPFLSVFEKRYSKRKYDFMQIK